MRAAFRLKDRSDQELLEGVWVALTRECEDVAVMIAHLAEIDKRKLFAEEGCSSLKSYCMEVLHLSEDQAYLRMGVARLTQKFPVILEMLADGLVHLTAVDRLGPSLTQENHLAILEEATYKSMAKVEEMVARLRPKPPVPSCIRKVSSPRADADQGMDGLFEAHSGSAGCVVEPESVLPDFSRKSVVSPLAPEMYDIHFTADKETVDALKLLQELLSHQVRNGDPAIIIKDSLLMRLKQVQRQRFGKGKRQNTGSRTPRRAGSPEPAEKVSVKDAAGEQTDSRYIPSEVKSAVWERDQGRCAFVARNGRWCSERRWIEFHHVVPFAWGGESTVENIELRCRTHNAYEGELIFGKVLRKSSLKRRLAGAPTGFKTSSSVAARPTG
jgi:hypothetical protein